MAAVLAAVLRRLYERVPLGMRLGLTPMREACARRGHPDRAFPVVHVAGTNGKGSVCAMVESIARAHGLRTGLYTSPHLVRFAERIQIDGQPIDDDALAETLDAVLDEDPPLSFFEAATLTAFTAFRAEKVDVAIVEVGLGGRLDATNVVPTPRTAAITRIAMDHADRLGTSLVEIAREKAGIAKPGLDIVLGPMPPQVRRAIDAVARENGATTSDAQDDPIAKAIGLPGEHQVDNARIAATLGVRLGASRQAIEKGLATVRWPGRLERIGRYLLDAAHNPDGAGALARFVASLGVLDVPRRRGSIGLVFGAMADKNWRSMLELLLPLTTAAVFVAPEVAARSAVDPQTMTAEYGGTVAPTVELALDMVQGELVVVTGSLILVGAARAALLDLPKDPPVAL
jgi:dihydrofolate synthase / folylpolyglutamate synthase